MKKLLKSPVLYLILTQVVIFISTFSLLAQESLQLSPAKWKLSTERYRITWISDDRKDKSTVVKIIQAGKTKTIRFKSDLSTALKNHLEGAITTSGTISVPLKISIERMSITDLVTGTTKHKITADICIKFYREIDSVPQLLYESSMKPVLTATGNRPPGVFENLLAESLEETFEQFNEWTKKNHDNPYFMNHVAVRFQNDGTFSQTAVSDTLRWHKDYRLTWDDFQGSDNGQSPFSAQSNCIYTLKTIPSFSNDTLYVTEVLHACFTKKASWVKDDSHQDSLLMHEQLHFDLCELYGRKFRKRLSEQSLSLLKFDDEIKRIFEATWKEYSTAQQLYDAETEHGIIREKQDQWINNVREELEEISEFACE